METFFDYSKMCDFDYSQQVFNAAVKELAKPDLFANVSTSLELKPAISNSSLAAELIIHKIVDNSNVSIPLIFMDDGVFMEIVMLVQLRDDYELTKLNAKMLEDINCALYDNREETNFKKCRITPVYTSPRHVQISRSFEKTTNFEKDVEELVTLYVEMFPLPFSFFKTVEKRINKGMVSSKTSEEGCYIATCVYGSYDCPEVWTLRRYRDNTLAKTWYGKMFIRTYYAISPTLVKWFGDTKWFKKMWQGALNKMVEDLQASGVESTPYKDKA